MTTTLQAIVDRRPGDSFFGVHLDPGHQLHLRARRQWDRGGLTCG